MIWLVKLSLGLTWNRTASTSTLTHDPQGMLARMKYLKQQIFIMAEDMMLVLWAADINQLPNHYFSPLVQLKSLEKRHSRDTTLNERYANTFRQDLEKGYLITVPDAHKVEQRSDIEWYLPYHPVVNQNKPGKCVGY